MNFDYGLNDRPPVYKTLLMGLQWLAISIPAFVITASVVCSIYSVPAEGLILYIQKLFFISSMAMLIQIFFGHRLPLVIGPATILLVGIIAAQGRNPDTVYTSIMAGGVLILILSVSGFFAYLQKLFTAPVVSVVLLLIVFTLLPAIMNLVTDVKGTVAPTYNLLFAFVLILFMITGNHFFKGTIKSTLVIWGMLIGSIVYNLIFTAADSGLYAAEVPAVSSMFRGFVTDFSFDWGIIISFVFCFIAMSINDLGSIQAMGRLIEPGDMKGRITRGVAVTGLASMVSGFFGVIGQVNFSLSAGIITFTKCASRFTLVPAAILMLLISFSPMITGLLAAVPHAVIGAMLFYIMCSQFSAGIMVLFEAMEEFDFNMALTVGASILAASLVSFLPKEIISMIPLFLQPVLGNGFVIGIITALFLEHAVFRKTHVTA